MTCRITFIGEAMVEHSITDPISQVKFAGDVLNTAVYLKRSLQQRADVCLCSVIGEDDNSDKFISYLQSEAINTSLISRVANRTMGEYYITVDEHGERRFTYDRDQSAARLLFTSNMPPVQSFGDIVLLSAITLAILSDTAKEQLCAFLSQFRHLGGKVAFDSNFRPPLWQDNENARYWVERLWRMTDIALPSLDDEMALFGDQSEQAVLSRFANYPIHIGALKRGAQGPYALGTPNPEQTYLPAEKVIDTTAAGDAFNAGFLSAIVASLSTAEALTSGHKLSRKVIGHTGAIIPRP